MCGMCVEVGVGWCGMMRDGTTGRFEGFGTKD